jgi:hypothetical protein
MSLFTNLAGPISCNLMQLSLVASHVPVKMRTRETGAVCVLELAGAAVADDEQRRKTTEPNLVFTSPWDGL